MSGETLYEAPRRSSVSKMRVHDYLYDSSFIVSGARDYARTAFKAAMASAQVVIQPVYSTMFSELRQYPRMQVVYHPNCRLPHHVDRSYGAYLQKVSRSRAVPAPEMAGKERFKFSAMPKKLLAIKSATPDFKPPTPAVTHPTRPRNRGTQSLYRESSAQTTPWQPNAKPADGCENVPEVLYLDKLEWGPGSPYRTGDLPADFHTTEIINKMRHARKWMELVERGQIPEWVRRRDAIISDAETHDWIFREAEIDELQDIRLTLLHKLQQQKREETTSKTGAKLAKLWTWKKNDMERKIEHIRRTRDREIRKLTALHGRGGRVGLVQEMRTARGHGSATKAAKDPTSDLHAPRARHGYQARRRHAEIAYDPSLLAFEDHKILSEPPAWLSQCQDLARTASGHHLPRDETKLCERETKWSERFLENLHNDLKSKLLGKGLSGKKKDPSAWLSQCQDLVRTASGHRLLRDETKLCERETKWSERFLENLHNDLRKARLGAASSTLGPLRVLRPRRTQETPRPPTPTVEAVSEEEEASHQAALTLQRVLRGRAVQNLMYEGRSRASELTEELKTTHGLQREDRTRIAKEESRARDYHAVKTEAEQKEEAISALVEELCGGAVSAALDFLEKELRRLKEERRQHAFILIALREKTMREAAEAGRRQKEERRRREHDEMFKQVLGVTQETVDAYLQDVIADSVALAAEEDAVKDALAGADRTEEMLLAEGDMSSAEQNELVAELVQQFLLPEAHRAASRLRVAALQGARLGAARGAVFGALDEAEVKEDLCPRCGGAPDGRGRCPACCYAEPPAASGARDDRRWKRARRPHGDVEKTTEERYPPGHEIRCMLNAMVADAVDESRRHRTEERMIAYDCDRGIRERTEITLDARETVDELIARATGELIPPVKKADCHHYMKRIYEGALERSVPFDTHDKCPKDLPSEVRRRADEVEAMTDPSCKCRDTEPKSKVKFGIDVVDDDADEKSKLLPSELRVLEELRRCKCDTDPSPSTSGSPLTVYDETDATTTYFGDNYGDEDNK